MNTPNADEPDTPGLPSRHTISELVTAGERRLLEGGIPDPRREAASLLCFALGLDRSFLIAHPEHLPTEQETRLFLDAVERRRLREPFHYVTGSKEFFGLNFEVSPAVLIPRPETEMVVERGIDVLAGKPEATFCEVGVGSGCISVAILVNQPKVTSVGLEISAEAIGIARRNAVRHAVDERFEIRDSDIFTSLRDDERFDLIVSNPPYVPAADINELQPEVRDHEPHTALTDGGDGLSIIRRIVAEAPAHLVAGGVLIFEMGIGQADAVSAMFDSKIWRQTNIHKDLQGIPRVAAAKLHR